MSALARTVTLLWVVMVYQCTFSPVDSRPFNSKKHTVSPSKHHHLGHKNAIGTHPLKSSSAVRHLGLGSFKPAKTMTPFHFSPTQHRGIKNHHKPSRDALKHGDRLEAAGLGPDFNVPFVPPPVGSTGEETDSSLQFKPKNGFEIWGEHAASHPEKESQSESANAPGLPAVDATEEIQNPGKSASPPKPLRHKPAMEPSKAIYMVPGEPPRIVEESFADGDFGTLLSSEDDQGTNSEIDGWFMSMLPYPEPEAEQDQSSSSDFAGIWGAFRDKKN